MGTLSQRTYLLLWSALALCTVPAHAYADDWDWNEVIASPRIGSRFTALAVDAHDASFIYVGTEEGTLLVSEDGGDTFDERAVVTHGVVDRSVSLQTAVETARAAGDVNNISSNYRIRMDPPFATRPSSRPGFQFDTLFFSTRPDFMSAEVIPSARVTWGPSLLSQAAAQRRDDLDPVTVVRACPGGSWPLLVATNSGLYGSDDHGVSFASIFSSALAPIVDVRCNRAHDRSARIAVATTDGVFSSFDGGMTFVPSLSGISGRAPNRLFAAESGELYIAGDRDVYVSNDIGLDAAPLFEQNAAVPSSSVRSVLVDPSGSVFVGTAQGLRVVRDRHLEMVAPLIFEGHEIREIVSTHDDHGREALVALTRDCVRSPGATTASTCNRTHMFESLDHGDSWSEIHEGITRRTMLSLVAGSERHGVFALSTGELWGSRAALPHANDETADPELVRWAQHEIDRAPGLHQVMTRVMDNTELDEETIDQVSRYSVGRLGIPLLQATFDYQSLSNLRDQQTLPTQTIVRDALTSGGFVFLIQASWNWGFELPGLRVEEPNIRERVALQALRAQVAFSIEDAWHQRTRALNELARGEENVVRALALLSRVEVLDALVNAFAGETIVDTLPLLEE